ncbi:MAG: hypothetical protein ABL958_18490 [Bdellovibrionia bacterium]
MKRLIAILALCPMIAFAASKEEREYMKTEVKPAVDGAQAAYKTACGCALTIKIADSIKTKDDMYQAKYIANSVKDEAAGYCTDAESKKAVCQMKTLEITKGKESKFTFSGGKGVSVTDGNSFYGFSMMTPELDK